MNYRQCLIVSALCSVGFNLNADDLVHSVTGYCAYDSLQACVSRLGKSWIETEEVRELESSRIASYGAIERASRSLQFHTMGFKLTKGTVGDLRKILARHEGAIGGIAWSPGQQSGHQVGHFYTLIGYDDGLLVYDASNSSVSRWPLDSDYSIPVLLVAADEIVLPSHLARLCTAVIESMGFSVSLIFILAGIGMPSLTSSRRVLAIFHWLTIRWTHIVMISLVIAAGGLLFIFRGEESRDVSFRPNVFYLGEVTVGSEHGFKIPIRNDAYRWNEITSIRSSCGCLTIEANHFSIGPDSTKFVTASLLAENPGLGSIKVVAGTATGQFTGCTVMFTATQPVEFVPTRAIVGQLSVSKPFGIQHELGIRNQPDAIVDSWNVSSESENKVFRARQGLNTHNSFKSVNFEIFSSENNSLRGLQFDRFKLYSGRSGNAMELYVWVGAYISD